MLAMMEKQVGNANSAVSETARARARRERTCLVTRQAGSPEHLIRFALDPSGRVTPDLKEKLPGRGVWVGGARRLVEQAIKKNVFARGFKTAVQPLDGLADQIDALLERDALQSLAIANKAGAVTVGFAKVEAAIGGGSVACLLHAQDGGADGKRKLRQGLRRRFGDALRPEYGFFASTQLDAALGRLNVVHAALDESHGAKVFLASCRRLALYRGEEMVSSVQGDCAFEASAAENEDRRALGLGLGAHDVNMASALGLDD